MITEKSDETSAPDETDDKELLRIAKERFAISVEAENQIRKDGLEDAKFSLGEQWHEKDLNDRKVDGRPALVINRMPGLIRAIANDARQNPIAIKISPVDSKADIETARIFQGLIRNIEYSSNADTAYDTAIDSSGRRGYGFFRILTDYCDPKSFDQEIKIKRVLDPDTCRLDPSYREPDGSDAEWGFVEDLMSKENFTAQHPDTEISQAGFTPNDSDAGEWVTETHVRVVEYFYREWTKTTICQLSNGDVVEKKELPEKSELAANGLEILAERETSLPKMKWAKLCATEVLDKKDWAGRWVPIIPVHGEEVVVAGKKSLAGIIRYSKDSQRSYNYYRSAEAETIALAPKAPSVGYAGQFEGFEEEWSQSNRRSYAYLEVNPTMINGQLAPLPQRNGYEPPIQALSQASMLASDDIKATSGIQDAAIGAQSNEKSGIAIQRRANQSQLANFHLVDNLSKSVRHCGRQLVDLIPKIYDTPRAVRILGEDGSEEVVTINAIFHKDGKPVMKNGKPVQYNLDVGKYDVAVSTGPSYETKRQEAVSSMLELSRSAPQLMQIAGDIITSNMDFQGSDEVSKRMKKALPPKFQEDDSGAQPEIPPQVQQHLQALQQQNQQLTEHLNKALDPFELKRMELESRERIAMANIKMQGEIALLKTGSAEAINLMDHDVANLERQEAALNFGQPIESQTENQSSPQAMPQGAGPDLGQSPQASLATVQPPTGGSSPGQSMGAP